MPTTDVEAIIKNAIAAIAEASLRQTGDKWLEAL